MKRERKVSDKGENKIQKKTWITLSHLVTLTPTKGVSEEVEASRESEEVERKDETKVKQN